MHRDTFPRIIFVGLLIAVVFGSLSSCGGGGGGGGERPGPVCNVSECPFPTDPRCVCVLPDDHGDTQSDAAFLTVGGRRTGKIEVAGDVDMFSIIVGQPGTLTVQTTGGLDTTGWLLDSDGVIGRYYDDGLGGINFSIEYPNAVPGTYYVRVSAVGSDTGNYTVWARFDAQPVNRAPERLGDIPAQTRTVGASETVDVSAFFEDPDGDSLGYSVQVSDPAIVVATVSGERVTFRAVAAGTVTITVTATDAGGLSATQTFTVEVEEDETDRIDDFNVGIPSSCPREVEICVRDHQCEDGDQIRVSVNGGVVFSGELFNAADCRIVPVREGTNSVELFAINGTGFKGACDHADVNTGEITIRGSTASVETQNWLHSGGTGSRANLNVTVAPTGAGCIPGSQPANRAPERLGDIPAQMRTVGASETVDVSAFFEDPDGDSLGYSVQVSDPAIVVATVSGERVTFRAVAAGTVTITVTATDAGGLSATQTFTVEVSEG